MLTIIERIIIKSMMREIQVLHNITFYFLNDRTQTVKLILIK